MFDYKAKIPSHLSQNWQWHFGFLTKVKQGEQDHNTLALPMPSGEDVHVHERRDFTDTLSILAKLVLTTIVKKYILCFDDVTCVPNGYLMFDYKACFVVTQKSLLLLYVHRCICVCCCSMEVNLINLWYTCEKQTVSCLVTLISIKLLTCSYLKAVVMC